MCGTGLRRFPKEKLHAHQTSDLTPHLCSEGLTLEMIPKLKMRCRSPELGYFRFGGVKQAVATPTTGSLTRASFQQGNSSG